MFKHSAGRNNHKKYFEDIFIRVFFSASCGVGFKLQIPSKAQGCASFSMQVKKHQSLNPFLINFNSYQKHIYSHRHIHEFKLTPRFHSYLRIDGSKR